MNNGSLKKGAIFILALLIFGGKICADVTSEKVAPKNGDPVIGVSQTSQPPAFVNVVKTPVSQIKPTAREKSWLEKNPSVNFGVTTSFPPFSFIGENNEPIGMAMDYLEIIRKRAGIDFRITVTGTHDEIFPLLKTKQIDGIPYNMKTPEREQYQNFTTPYITINLVVVTRNDYPFVGGIENLMGKKVGVLRKSAALEFLRNYPGIEIILTDTQKQLWESVSFGKTDAVVLNLATAGYFISELGITNLKVAYTFPEKSESGMSVRKDRPELLSILNKAIALITPEEHARIHRKWMSLRYEQGVHWQDVWRWLAIVSVLFTSVIITTLIWNRRLAREINERRRAEEALRETAERLSLAKSAGQIGIWDLDLIRNHLVWDARMFEIYGVTPDSFGDVYESWQRSVHPDDLGKAHAEVNSAIEGHGEFHTEFRIVHPDGQIRNIEAHAKVIYTSDGTPLRMIGVNFDITGHKQAEEALQRSNSILKAQNEASMDCILVVDEHRKVASYNQKFAQLWNIPDDLMRNLDGKQLIEHTLPILKHPDKFFRRIQYLYENKSESSHEEIEFADGRIVDRYSSPVFTPENQFLGRIWFYRDISDRKRAEQALMDEEEKYRGLVENINHVVYLLDNKGEFVYISPVVEKIAGYQPEELIGTNFAKYIYPEDFPALSDRFKQVVEGKTITSEYRIYHKSGEIFWVRTSSHPWTKNGVIAGAQGLLTDITKNKKAEEKISQILTEQKIILDHATVGIALLRNREFVWLNKFIENMFGYSKEELIGAKTELFYPSKESCEELGRNAYPLLSQGKIYQTERQMRRKDNSLFWCDLTGIAVNSENTGEGSIWIFQDIDRKKHAEQEIIRAKEAAEAANRTKSQFLANMSHEIRTPMNAVLGFLQLSLESPDLPKSQKENLTIAFKSAKSLLVLLNDILDLSKLESGRLKLEEDTFDPAALIRDTIRTFESKAKEKGLNISCDMSPDLSKCHIGAPVRLKQILVNLIGNAIKFTEKGGIAVVVKSIDERIVHFSITDTGIGIPKERIPKIFEPFAQADSSTSRRFGGTGLGTTISKQLVALMGGNIWVESGEGKGSTFHFTVRMRPADTPSPVSPCLSKKDGNGAERKRVSRRFKILLAEDIEENIRLGKIRLERQGHTVVVARNGTESIDAFQQDGNIDAVLMDVHMPEMDGLEATRRIREMEKNFRVPIIALTASVMKTEREACMEAGMDAIVGKPVDFDELFAVVERLVPKDRGAIMAGDEKEKNDSRDPLPSFGHLSGINIEKGLRVWQDPEAYMDRLVRFSNDYRDAADVLAHNLECGDTDGACELAHALKGVSGNLSVTDVFVLAGKIYDTVAKGKQDDAKAMIPDLKNAMDKFLVSVRGLERETKSKEEKPPEKKIDPKHLAKLFRDMLSVIDQYNPEEIEPFLSELLEYLPASQIGPLKNRVARFEFKNAKEEVLKLAEALGIDMARLIEDLRGFVKKD